MNVKISPSLLSCDFGKLNDEILWLNKSNADFLHIDVMDGVFVPNISFGFPIIEAVKKKCSLPLDVHIMIQNPELYFQQFKKSGADLLTFHYEATKHVHRAISQIKELGMKAGVALNPHSPVSLLKDVIKDIDLVLIMSVNPGFGGQKFIEYTYEKIKELKNIIHQQQSKTLIEVDGGVSISNSQKLIESGADILVAGSAIFNSENPQHYIDQLKMKG